MKTVIFGILVTLLLSTTVFAQSAANRDCDRAYLMKNPSVALACGHQSGRSLLGAGVLQRSDVTSLALINLPVTSQIGRFTVPFLFREWHVAAGSGRSFDLPDADIMRAGMNSCWGCDSHEGWAMRQADNIRYFNGDETAYHLGPNNLLFDLRFSFYSSIIR